MGDMSRSVDLLRQRYETRIKELEAQRGDDVQDMTDDTHRLMPEGHTQNIFDDLCQQQQHDKCIELLNERIEMLEAQVDDYKKERDEWKHSSKTRHVERRKTLESWARAAAEVDASSNMALCSASISSSQPSASASAAASSPSALLDGTEPDGTGLLRAEES
ncbi:unnamed protein product [Vitrella brassicaformis CCMP3155]|uniref:Uncharacterized protein n=1 Tax=Vitrella brassicaformis (strain CCMP3155) TaxID=1169540 RepID=A0A0G4ER14_VITBC|nr:unnamed protein product [Vitrella brassicaformis CCMP3155]|eukprot:CEL99700.1 unnamed protein product [Vitrella brassicaformis CCMP3155]